MDAAGSSRNEDDKSRIVVAAGGSQSTIYWTNAFQQRLSHYTEIMENDVNSLDLATRANVQADIDAELKSLDSLLTSFRYSLAGRRNMLSFAYLNPDVLIDIFSILRDSYAPRGAPLPGHSVLGWIAVTHVCKRWREIACHEPSLWSSVVASLGIQWYRESILRAKTLPLTIIVGSFHRIKLPDIFTALVVSPHPRTFRNVILVAFGGRHSMYNPMELVETLTALCCIPTLREIYLHYCCTLTLTVPAGSFKFPTLAKLSVRGMDVHELALMMEMLRLSPACSVQLISTDMDLAELRRLMQEAVSQLNGDPAVKAPQYLRIGARAFSLYRTLPAGGSMKGRPNVPEILSLGVPRKDMIWPVDVFGRLGAHTLRHLRFLHISHTLFGLGFSSNPWEKLFAPCVNIEGIHLGKSEHCSLLFEALVSDGQSRRVLLPRLNRIDVDGRRLDHACVRWKNARSRQVGEWGRWYAEEDLVAALTYRKNAGFLIETLRLNDCNISEECQMEILPALVKDVYITHNWFPLRRSHQ